MLLSSFPSFPYQMLLHQSLLIHPSIHPSNKYILRHLRVPGTVPGLRDGAGNKAQAGKAPEGWLSLVVGEAIE